MGAGHSHALYVHEHSVVHRLDPAVKVVAAFGSVVAIAITPREALVAFGIYALTIAALTRVARIPARFVVIRLVGIAPFVLFALLIPFVADGPTSRVLGMELSVDGLWAMWNILAKATLGAAVTIVLTATTEVADIIGALGRLRVPALFTAIASFMMRYLELTADELRRMRVAMTARGYDPRWLTQAKPIATSAGALFVRSYERGERVHAAMIARGFTGEMPALDTRTAGGAQWAGGIGLVGLFMTVAIAALLSA